jgi:hypothetical protein
MAKKKKTSKVLGKLKKLAKGVAKALTPTKKKSKTKKSKTKKSKSKKK